MIEIKKGREPDRLLWYRQQKGASYEEMDKDVKEELLKKLLQEQGHLCAYCMKRIPEKQGRPPVSIEHWLPRNPDSKEDLGQGLDYRNMLAVCSGNRECGDKRGMTCDAYRGNEPLKVNPCDGNTLRGITYTSAGRIQSSDPDIDDDLNRKLNLNNEKISLPENRKKALQELFKDIKKKHGTGDISLYCKRKLEKIREADDPKMSYAGILIWWLEKKCRQTKESGTNR